MIRKPEELRLAFFSQCVEETEAIYSYASGSQRDFVNSLAYNCRRMRIEEHIAKKLILSNYCYDYEEVKTIIGNAYNPNMHHGTESKDASSYPQIINLPGTDTYGVRIEKFLLTHYCFRFNEITSRTEYKEIDQNVFRPITDYCEKTILRKLERNGYKVNLQKLRNILQSDFSKRFNPFQSYFDSLPAWDRQIDHIQLLANTIGIKEKELWTRCLRKWLVAMVGGLLDDKTVNHTGIIFSGPQGIGKTTWLEKLVPLELEAYRYSGTINPNSKDSQIHLSECMLINMDELENMNRKDIGALKYLMTLGAIRLRRPYGHNQETLIRRSSFVGSVNTTEFLTDTTGSRRFLCFEVFIVEYQHQVSIDQVYAQAYALFREGFQFFFDQSEIKQIQKHNEKYQFRYPEEELLLTHYRKPVEEESSLLLTASQIGTKLSITGGIRIDAGSVMKIGKALAKHGFDHYKRTGSKVYAVIEKDFSVVDREKEKKDPAGNNKE